MPSWADRAAIASRAPGSADRRSLAVVYRPAVRQNRAREAEMVDQPTAEQALKELESLVGEWALEAITPGGEPWPGEARATFEWHDSGAHLVQRWTIDLPE